MSELLKFLFPLKGEPNAPIIGELISGPGVGQITITVKFITLGINKSSEGFHFIVTPFLVDGTEEADSRKYFFPNYQSGTFVTIVVEGLMPEENYQFSVSAANMFGSSLPTLSAIISAGIGLYVAIYGRKDNYIKHES